MDRARLTPAVEALLQKPPANMRAALLELAEKNGVSIG
jgi:hypothetical protein